MKLKLSSEHDDLTSIFREASSFLRDNQTSFKRATATVRDGCRHSSYDGYLKPALGRKNLHILLKTQAVLVSYYYIKWPLFPGGIGFQHATIMTPLLLQTISSHHNMLYHERIHKTLCLDNALSIPLAMTLLWFIVIKYGKLLHQKIDIDIIYTTCPELYKTSLIWFNNVRRDQYNNKQ